MITRLLLLALLTSTSTSRGSSLLLVRDAAQRFAAQPEVVNSSLIEQEETSKSLNQVADIRLVPNVDVYTRDQLERIQEYHLEPDALHGRHSIGEFVRRAIETNFHTYPYNDLLFHRYADLEELRGSGGPSANQRKCVELLEEMVERSERVSRVDKFRSNDTNIYQLLDTFGRVPAGLLRGNTIWLGAYDECLRLKIRTSNNGGSLEEPTRYCTVSFRLRDWNRKRGPFEQICALRSAVCLPKVCDSLNFENKFQLIGRLMAFNARDLDKAQFQLNYLYCLPDEQSPVVDWSRSRPTVIVLSLLGGWLAILIYCSVKSFSKTRTNQLHNSLSIPQNLKRLFETSQDSGPSKGHRSGQLDLSVVEGIKVIAMMHVVIGHVFMCMSLVFENGRDNATTNSLPYHLSNMIPALNVNSFFVITAILTSYSTFRDHYEHRKSGGFLYRPRKWLAAFLWRYLRIMPTYLVVLAYAKTLAKFAGSGPLWDYGTSPLSPRRNCEHQESWLLTLLMAANTQRHPMQQCLPSAWYLANDFQYLLVTPFFLILLHKFKRLGKTIVRLVIATSMLASFLNVYLNHQEHDMRSVAMLLPNAFQTHVTFMVQSYVRPQHRIGPYLIGLIIGYDLFKFEQTRLKLVGQMDNNNKKLQPKGSLWLKFEKLSADRKREEKITLALVALIFCLNMLVRAIPYTQWSALVIFAAMTPLIYNLYSLAIGSYVSIAATGNGIKLVNRFIGARFWKPISRVSLCVLLINIEIILYIVQSRRRMVFVDATSSSILILVVFVATFLAAVALHVLVEAPVKMALEHLVGRGRRAVRERKDE